MQRCTTWLAHLKNISFPSIGNINSHKNLLTLFHNQFFVQKFHTQLSLLSPTHLFPLKWYHQPVSLSQIVSCFDFPLFSVLKNYPITSYVCLYVSVITFLNGYLCSLYSWRQSSACTFGPCHILHYIRIQEIVGHIDK